MLYLILIAAFVEAILITFAFYSGFKRQSIVTRMGDYFEWEDRAESQKDPKLFYKETIKKIGRKLINILILGKYREKIQQSLENAGMPINAEELIFIMFSCTIFVWLTCFFSTRNIILCFITVILIILMFWVVVTSKAKKRLLLINEQLEGALDMISSSLKAGFSILRSIEEVSNNMPEPISKEFSKIIREIGLGLSMEKALENFQERVPLEDLKLLVTSVMIQRQVGGNLSEILDNISETIRERIKLKREMKTLTAQGRISGLVVAAIPVFIAIVIYFMDPEYITVLFKSRTGLLLLGGAVINETIGFLIIKKLLDIQY